MIEKIKKILFREKPVIQKKTIEEKVVVDPKIIEAYDNYKKLWDLYYSYDGKRSMLQFIESVLGEGYYVKVVKHLGRPMMPNKDTLFIDLDFYKENVPGTHIEDYGEVQNAWDFNNSPNSYIYKHDAKVQAKYEKN